MGRRPYCKSREYEIDTVNQVKMKKCSSCGAYYEDVGEKIPGESFVPLCEPDASGVYPFCPRCGSCDIKYLKADEVMIRSSRLAALLAGMPYDAGGGGDGVTSYRFGLYFLAAPLPITSISPFSCI